MKKNLLESARHIIVEGPIGVGKTSLARRLGEHLEAELLLEQPETNPFPVSYTHLDVYKRQEQGYKAYVVGGAVRDLLAGITPKDYDVATNATPEQVRHCFRRSRIIGRRFQIVHVMMGAETIEVTTFRGHHDQ